MPFHGRATETGHGGLAWAKATEGLRKCTVTLLVGMVEHAPESAANSAKDSNRDGGFQRDCDEDSQTPLSFGLPGLSFILAVPWPSIGPLPGQARCCRMETGRCSRLDPPSDDPCERGEVLIGLSGLTHSIRGDVLWTMPAEHLHASVWSLCRTDQRTEALEGGSA
jgi:hypothetical protein